MARSEPEAKSLSRLKLQLAWLGRHAVAVKKYDTSVSPVLDNKNRTVTVLLVVTSISQPISAFRGHLTENARRHLSDRTRLEATGRYSECQDCQTCCRKRLKSESMTRRRVRNRQ
jgi:hypothetical protein